MNSENHIEIMGFKTTNTFLEAFFNRLVQNSYHWSALQIFKDDYNITFNPTTV